MHYECVASYVKLFETITNILVQFERDLLEYIEVTKR